MFVMERINPDLGLAASITKVASKQTYYTIRFLVDRERVADAYRAYAYFRWVDDSLDAEAGSRSMVSESKRQSEALLSTARSRFSKNVIVASRRVM